MKENYKKFPLPKGKEWFRLPERLKALEEKPAPAEFELPYKVFTALLTQNGESNTSYLYIGTSYGNTLTIGVSYTIEGNNNTDFTNVGAPNNNVGTSFIATGTTPNNQSNNDETYLSFDNGAPVAIVLENTIGDIWFTYVSSGLYRINSNNLFTEKTFMQVSNVTNIDFNSSGSTFIGLGLLVNSNLLHIQSVGFTDGDMYNTPIEIRVYN